MTEKKRDILNAGCGNRLEAGAVNMDRTKHRPEVDVVHDMNVIPWPFEDESFDLVIARASLEHLDVDLLTSINECWRILRPGGLLYVKLPFWQASRSYDDVTHRWRVSPNSLNMFDPTTDEGARYSFYTPYKWRIVKGPRFNNAKTSLFWTLQKVARVPEVEVPEAKATKAQASKAKTTRRRRKRAPEAEEAQAVKAAADLDRLIGGEQAVGVDPAEVEAAITEREGTWEAEKAQQEIEAEEVPSNES